MGTTSSERGKAGRLSSPMRSVSLPQDGDKGGRNLKSFCCQLHKKRKRRKEILEGRKDVPLK